MAWVAGTPVIQERVHVPAAVARRLRVVVVIPAVAEACQAAAVVEAAILAAVAAVAASPVVVVAEAETVAVAGVVPTAAVVGAARKQWRRHH